MRWLDSITNSIDVNLYKLWEIVKDRGAWHECWSPWGSKESDMTYQVDYKHLLYITSSWHSFSSWKFMLFDHFTITRSPPPQASTNLFCIHVLSIDFLCSHSLLDMSPIPEHNLLMLWLRYIMKQTVGFVLFHCDVIQCSIGMSSS